MQQLDSLVEPVFTVKLFAPVRRDGLLLIRFGSAAEGGSDNRYETMNSQTFSVYLNDHLAASGAALDLLTRLKSLSSEEPARRELEALLGEIAEDREALREVMRRLEISESVLRRAAARAGGWVARVKLETAGLKEGGTGRLQALETLLLGVTGKTALWRVLREGPGTGDRLRGMPLEFLHDRSREHCARVETLRFAAARQALES